jgi:RND family efflux transporter MFP subunit
MIRFFPNLSPTRHFVPLLLLTLALRGVMASTHAAEEPATVLTVIAEKSEGILRTLSLTGTVTARREARLSSRATGLVMEMRVDEGDMVKMGDVLMTLDTDLAGITLEGIRAEIARSRVQLDEAKRQEEEVRELVKGGSFPKSEAETRKSTVLVNEANLQQLLVREREQIEMIARHQLVAPFSGVISRKLSEEGEWVPTGTPVLELVEIEGGDRHADVLLLAANVGETEVNKLDILFLNHLDYILRRRHEGNSWTGTVNRLKNAE